MAALSTLRTDIRNRLVESTADFFSNSELNEWINHGYKQFVARTEWCEKVKAYNVVANQFEYDLPSDAVKVNLIRWEDKYPVKHKDLEEFSKYAGFSDQTSDRPSIYRQWPWDAKLRIYPIPSAASASSPLNGGINSSVTSLTVDDATNFPARGRVIVNSEQILYFAKSGNVLSQLVRGDGYTTAAAHLDNDVVYYAPLEVYLNYMPTALSADGDTTRLGPVYDEALVHYAIYTALQKRDKYKEAQFHKQMFDEIAKHAREERDKMNRDRLFYIKEEDSWSELL